MPQNDQIWPKIDIFGQFGPGHTGFFGALVVGGLVVVARGLYLARFLFTLLSNSNSDPYTLLSGPSLTSKPLQEHRFECYDGASTLLTVQHFTFHILDKL